MERFTRGVGEMSVNDSDSEIWASQDGPRPEQQLGLELDPGEGRGFPYSELHIARGWLPDSPSAPAPDDLVAHPMSCHDAAVVLRHFAGEPTWAFAGVFDGHGTHAKKASCFVRDELPVELAQDKALLVTDPVAAVTNAARRVHARLVDAKRPDGPRADMSFSGTTACFVVTLGIEEEGSGWLATANQGSSNAALSKSKSVFKSTSGWLSSSNGSGKTGEKAKSSSKSLSAWTKSLLFGGNSPSGSGGGRRGKRLVHRIVVGSVGDSQAALMMHHAGGSRTGVASPAHALTHPHIFSDEEEAQRIRARGGSLRGGNAAGEHLRVYQHKQAFPAMPVSRSLGDLNATALGVIPDPTVTLHEIPVEPNTDASAFVLLGTNGLWEGYSPNEAAAHIQMTIGASYDPQVNGKGSATRLLVEEAQRRAATRQPGAAVDEATALAVWLETPSFADALLLTHPIALTPGYRLSMVSRSSGSLSGDERFEDEGLGNVEEDEGGEIGGGTRDVLGGEASGRSLQKERLMESDRGTPFSPARDRRIAVSSEPGFSSLNKGAAAKDSPREEDEVRSSIDSLEIPSSFLRTPRMFEKRYAEMEDEETAAMYNSIENTTYPKDEATAAIIKQALSKHFLFKGISSEVLEGIVHQMFEVTVEPGQRLIQQGAPGNNMYVCTSGSLDCHVSTPGFPEPGPKVLEYGPGSSFGELTLMYDCPRPSTVQAATTSRLWVIDREMFSGILVANVEAGKTLQVLSEAPVLSSLTEKQLTDVAAQMKIVEIADSPCMIHMAGSKLDGFYIVLDGTLAMRWGDGGGCHPLISSQKPRVVSKGAAVGMRACAYKQTLRHDMIAATPCRLAHITGQLFNSLSNFIMEQVDVQIVVGLLRALPATSTLDDGELEEIARMFRFHTFDRGTTLIRGDRVSHALLAPLMGELSVMPTKEAREAARKEGSVRGGRVITSRGAMMLSQAAAEEAEARANLMSGLPMKNLHTGWFGASALVINDVVEREIGDVIVSSPKCEAVVLDAAGCDALASMIERKDIKGALRSVELLDSLSDPEIEALVPFVTPRRARDGEVLVRQGDQTGFSTDVFYIIHQGEVAVIKRMLDRHTNREVTRDIIRLHKGDYFGERALLNEPMRTASCVAKRDDTYLFTIDRAAFETHLGPLRKIIDRHVAYSKELERAKDIQLGELRQLTTIGMGTFGRVRLVQHRGSGKTYALKLLSKEKIVRYKQEQHVRDECLLMRKISNPFCARLIKTFKDDIFVYMLLEAVMGGELFRYLDLQPKGAFPEDWCVFYAGCVLLALDHLHVQDIVYRDMKPENLLLDERGYLKVVDYGFAKHVTKRTYTVCGTPDYIAPEVILRKGHNKAVDFWALGVLIYEMLTGVPPFSNTDSTDQQIYQNILESRFVHARTLSSSAKDLLSKLLRQDPNHRLGCGRAGSRDVKQHRWFSKLDWNALARKAVQAPIVPSLKGVKDTSNYDKYEEEDDILPPQEGTCSWDDIF